MDDIITGFIQKFFIFQIKENIMAEKKVFLNVFPCVYCLIAPKGIISLYVYQNKTIVYKGINMEIKA